MIPNKPSLVTSDKSSPHMTVTFQNEDTNELLKDVSSKRSTRKKAAEPFVIHEIRSWSSFVGIPSVEQVLTDIDKRSINSNISTTSNNQHLQQVIVDQSLSFNQERPHRSRSALIDRKKHHSYRQNELTWHSLFGTMSDINYIITDKTFLPHLPCLQTFIIFIDSCFRGIGQTMFANNPLSGLVSLKQNYSLRIKTGEIS
jgi:hypothetical protein